MTTDSINNELNIMKASTGALPPKSPSSVILSGKFLLFATASSNQTKASRRRRRRSKEKRDAKTMQHGNDSDRLSDESLVHQHSLVDDPSPRHLSVIVTGDDLSTTGDFSKVSIQNCPELIQNLPEIPTFKRRVSIHRRAKSWDSSYSHRRDTNNKTSCFQVTSSFFRRQKVIPADRSELYEHAKTILNTGNYQQALEMFQTLQTAQQKRFGKAHFTVAAAMHNVGVVRLRMGQPKDAEQILTEAVAIRRKVLGNDQLDLAVSLGKLGSAQVVLCKFDDAIRNLREAMKIIQETLGHYSRNMAQTLCILGCLYFEAGELFSAQATFEDAVDIYQSIFPTEIDRDACTVQMTEALCNIGSIQNKRKKFHCAIQSFSEALDLQRGVLGLDDPRVIASLDNLAYSFSKSKSYNRSLSCYKEMTNAQLSYHGEFTVECCDTLKKQIMIYEKRKDLNGALKATKKALEKAATSPSTKDFVLHSIQKMRFKLEQKREKQRKTRGL